MFLDFFAFLIAICSLVYIICVILYPDITLHDNFDLVRKRIKIIKQHDAEHRHLVQPAASIKIDTTFIIALTTNYAQEIQIIVDFLHNYRQQHENYNVQLIMILTNSEIQNRLFINITTDIVNLFNIVFYDKKLTKMDLFSAAVLSSSGNIVYLHDFDEFSDLDVFTTFLRSFGKNHRQMVIATRSGTKSVYSNFESKIVPIFNTDDNFLITRMFTKEAAHRVFSNMHINDEFFTMEANKLAKLIHCKIRIIKVHNFKVFDPIDVSKKKKYLRLLQIGFFYKINIWTYKRMSDAFITHAIL